MIRSQKCVGTPNIRWENYDEISIIRWEKCKGESLNGYYSVS